MQQKALEILSEDERTQDPVTVHAEVLTTWSESLGVSSEQMQNGFDRAAQIATEVGDTQDLDLAYEGLPPGVQRAIWTTLSDPSRRIEQIDALSDADFDALNFFLEAMTDAEIAAVERALGLR